MLTDPVRNIVPNLVYSATSKEVDLAMVAGRILLRDGRVLTADEVEVRETAQAMAEDVVAAVRRDPVHRELILLDAMDKGQL